MKHVICEVGLIDFNSRLLLKLSICSVPAICVSAPSVQQVHSSTTLSSSLPSPLDADAPPELSEPPPQAASEIAIVRHINAATAFFFMIVFPLSFI